MNARQRRKARRAEVSRVIAGGLVFAAPSAYNDLVFDLPAIERLLAEACRPSPFRYMSVGYAPKVPIVASVVVPV